MKFLKKWGTLLVAIFFLVIIAVLVLVGMKAINEYKDIVAKQEKTIGDMSSFIDNDIGPLVDCYVVNTSVRVGDEITEENLSLISIPEKIAYTTKEIQVENYDNNGQLYYTTEKETTMNVITNLNDVIGKKFRVSLDEGALMMLDYVVDEPLENSERYYELVVDSFPTNIEVGDYVDLRIQFTYGEDFIALPHKRVEYVDLSTGLFTFIFDESDIATYNSMLLDKAMYPVVEIYMLKYVDSSSQTSAETYYPVNQNISEILAINPNILEAVKEEMKLEREELNALMGGDAYSFDDKRLEDVKEYLENIREDVIKDKTQNIKDRVKEKEAQEKAAAKAAARK